MITRAECKLYISSPSLTCIEGLLNEFVLLFLFCFEIARTLYVCMLYNLGS